MEEKYCQGDLNDIIRAGGVHPMHNAEKSKWDSPPDQQLPNPNLAPLGHRITNFNDSLLHELSGSNCVDCLAEATNARAVADATGRSDLHSGGFHVSPVMSKGCSSASMTSYDVASQKNLGLGRRKSQERKVVCIPAVESANARPGGGEVVPSDLWAWRKYGQKPIKGSPYPRGYYRCSSSKGCSARKQVERSRTNPNMLVITYTSEHNHSWPIQRNALAGSTRLYDSKGSSSNTKGSSHQGRRHNKMRASPMEETTNGMNISCKNMTIDHKVKEESGENIAKTSDAGGNELHQIVEQRYDVVDSGLNNQNDALSKNMGKSDTLGISTDKGEKDSNKAIDPFELLNRVGNWTVE